MENPTKTKLTEAIAQAAALAQGAEQNAATVEHGNNTAANIRLDITGLTNAIAALNDGTDELRTRRLAVQQLAMQDRAFLMATRDTFKPDLGFIHNAAWNTVGMVNSLRIPQSPAKLLPVINAFHAYLGTRPELHDEDEGLTPALILARYDALDDAIGAVNSQETTVGNLKTARDEKFKALKRRIRGTITGLAQGLDPMDPRWDSYGLNRPGLKARPDQPQNIEVVLFSPTALSIKWSRAPRAAYYRVRKKVAGVDTDWVLAGSPADLDFLLEGIPANATVEIMISAVNNGGESIASEVITFQLS